MAYIGNNLDSDIQVNKYEYTATAGQTTFACTYDRAVDVYINGVKLAGSDFTATNGTAIVLTSGANDGDIVDINAYFDVTYAGADAILPDQTGNTGKFLTSDGTTSSWGAVDLNSRVAKTGDTMTGALNVPDVVLSNGTVSARLLPATADNRAYLVTTSAHGLSLGSNNIWDRLNIDSAGRVTMPYQPAFSVAGSSVTGSSGATREIIFPTVRSNIGNHYNSSTGKFTAPVAGMYHFSYTMFCVNGARYLSSIFVNTTHIQEVTTEPNGGGGTTNGYVTLTYSGNIYLQANDVVNVKTTANFISTADIFHSFGGYLIG